MHVCFLDPLEDRIKDFQKINTYHVGLVTHLLEKLKKTADGDGNLLDNSLVIYGSAMGNSNLHNHKRCPLFFAGKAGGALKGNLHVRAEDGTPMANAMLTVAHGLGLDEVSSFGDSTCVSEAETRLTVVGVTVLKPGSRPPDPRAKGKLWSLVP